MLEYFFSFRACVILEKCFVFDELSTLVRLYSVFQLIRVKRLEPSAFNPRDESVSTSTSTSTMSFFFVFTAKSAVVTSKFTLILEIIFASWSWVKTSCIRVQRTIFPRRKECSGRRRLHFIWATANLGSFRYPWLREADRSIRLHLIW